MSLVVDEHRHYLSDSVRLEAFRKAIGETVKPGDVVVDLGSGTGILGFLACDAGAARVYAVEAGSMIQLARALARANGYGERVIFVPGLSTEVDLPERADVIVTDQIGHIGFDAGLGEYFPDARRRFLRDGGVTVPASLTIFAAPVEAPDLFAQVDFWSAHPANLDFSPARSWAVNTGYPASYAPNQLLGAPAALKTIEWSAAAARPFKERVVLRAARAGVLHGVAAWFEARLSPSVTLTNSPLAGRRIRRSQEFFPIDRAVDVAEGDEITVAMWIDPVEIVVSWEVAVATRGEVRASFRHSTWSGMLISQEDLRRTRTDFVPRLTPRGIARRTVLELCDGARPLADVERETYARHRGLFRSPAEASAFVAEVVTRYAD